MKRYLSPLALAILALAFCCNSASAAPSQHKLTIDGGQFLLDGKPFQIISGEMHYPRIPREYWRARLKMARAMGLNSVTTYVFWNLHEPKPGVYDFSGQLDVAEFILEGNYISPFTETELIEFCKRLNNVGNLRNILS